MTDEHYNITHIHVLNLVSKHYNINVVLGFFHWDYCTEPTLRLDLDPNTSLARYNNNIIAYFSTYMSGFRATGNQIQADTSRYILNVTLHARLLVSPCPTRNRLYF